MNPMNTQAIPQFGTIIENAVVFNIRNWNGDRNFMPTHSLMDSVESLFALLDERGVGYVLVGGIALLQYVEGRNTEDLDLLMALTELARVPEIELSSQDDNFARGTYRGLQIDILLTRNPLFKKVQREYVATHRFLDRAIPLATVEGLILLKLYALPSLYRQGNFPRVGLYENDIATLIQAYEPDTATLLDELAAHVSQSDLTEIRTILGEIQGRIERFRRQ